MAGDAAAVGVAPTELSLTVQLQDAQLASGSLVTPRAEGGDGFVCCGAMKLFLVPIESALDALQAPSPNPTPNAKPDPDPNPNPSPNPSPNPNPNPYPSQVRVNVTAGALRAVFLKYQACPALPFDIAGEQCVGLCHMSWYASYDRFSGALQYVRANTTRVPKGDTTYPDKRAKGDWYIAHPKPSPNPKPSPSPKPNQVHWYRGSGADDHRVPHGGTPACQIASTTHLVRVRVTVRARMRVRVRVRTLTLTLP